MNSRPFTHQEAVQLWSRLVAGWANSLDNEGARTLIDGYSNHADAGGSYEGVTRMLWGLGGWLSQPSRSPLVTWKGITYDIEALTHRAYVNGCNPESPSYWGIEYNPARLHDQRTVETGQIAFALWQSKDRIWDKLDDQSIIDQIIGDYLDNVYCNEGWYDDASQHGVGYFDDYNFWVFGSHVLAWAQVDGENWADRRNELLDRIRLLMHQMEHTLNLVVASPINLHD